MGNDIAAEAAYLESFRSRHNDWAQRAEGYFASDTPTPWAKLDDKTKAEWRDRVAYTKSMYAPRVAT